ncbi:hypothetical protein [Amycolatopsis sp. NPDC059657]|uniref:hypothetical protein n=1 Tax=Amycolatopsis sp. NPDC059657 TaxID=3346899 RepID=UPI00366EADBF
MAFADHLDETVERIIDSAIEFYFDVYEWYPNLQGNYQRRHGLGDPEITPPGKPSRTSGGQVLNRGLPGYVEDFEFGSGHDAGTLMYAHFENTIREMFQPWKKIPTPSDFDGYLDVLRHGAWTLSLSSTGDKVSKVGNAKLDPVKYLQEKICGDDMGGNMIYRFAQNFCVPLPTVIQGQYTLALLAGVTLCGEREIWSKAQQDIQSIADKMYEAMQDRGKAVSGDLSTVTALFSLAAVFPTPASPVLAGVASALPALEKLMNAGSTPSKQEVEYGAGTPDKVIAKGVEALKTLAQTIRNCENDLKASIKSAMETVTSEPDSFNMPSPTLLKETKLSEMKVNLDSLRFIATSTLPLIEKELNEAADLIAAGSRCTGPWYRTTEINASDSPEGPMEAWLALVRLAEELTLDLAWEVRESSAHLEIATDRIGQTEAETEAALRRHATKLSEVERNNPIDRADHWLDHER